MTVTDAHPSPLRTDVETSKLLRRIEAWVRGATGEPTAPMTIREMPGGASSRRYFRVAVGGERPGSFVAMFAPEGAKPEEVEKRISADAATAPRWPFLEVRALLADRGVRVPEVVAEACDEGLLLLEDLGDATLAAALARAPDRREALYRRAVGDLAKMHRALVDLPLGSVVGNRAFDETLLRWELDHFVEFGLDARGVVRSPAARAALDDALGHLAKMLASEPRGFVHRDYQSRNLMIDPRGAAAGEADRLVVIDFQDAMLGPRSYDLVALLRDSYQDLDEPFVDQMLDVYAARMGFDAEGRATLRREVDRLTVQRKLKDAGRFVFIERKKGDASFLPFIAPSLRRVRGALERLAGTAPFDAIATLLAEALPSDFG